MGDKLIQGKNIMLNLNMANEIIKGQKNERYS